MSLVTVDFPAPGIPVTIRQSGLSAVFTSAIVSAGGVVGNRIYQVFADRDARFVRARLKSGRWVGGWYGDDEATA
ncbi:hypothetical protein M878_43120 [Streptomyces roseochromogenus subsp. oscitans DS 12.976]|uniref:Uncharacterized protein n=1 Tax=Streptomyces roseochromogenus subsp. oscitans DS 12.976 TaxID=1352936 RepID=V6JIS6_STRRC|nr:hypothetical protein M878_43120 [Streptomyces roseochromogenus subsp. oscitans DS 12.976]